MELQRNGVRLFFEEKGKGDPTFVFIHGTGGDHTHLEFQFDHFFHHARAINVDLRGHGKSDKPQQEYTIEGFADDVHWLCQSLHVSKPVIVGFSMGGNIAIEIASRYPDFPLALCILDSGFLYPEAVQQKMREYLSDLKGKNYQAVIHGIVENGSLPTDRCKEYAETSLLATPQYVWVSAFENMIRWDKTVARRLENLKLPILYIEAANPLVDLPHLKKLCPQLIHGKVIGSGHGLSLEVPEQVNAMIDRFMKIYL